MKLLKKTLILTSTLALGLTLVGCGKKSVAVNERYIYEYKGTKELSKVTNQLTMRVKGYSRINNRIYLYQTTNDETVIFDVLCNKEIYRTTDKVSDARVYLNGNVVVLTFDDDHSSRMAVATNGTILAEKGNYYSLNVSLVDEKLDRKKNKYRETIFAVLTKKIGEDSIVNFYKVTKIGVKSEATSRLMEDLSLDYKLVKITEQEAATYKKGDEYPKSKKNYSYEVNTNNIVFYDGNTSKILVEIKSSASERKVFMFKDKALVQVVEYTTSSDNYDFSSGDSYYNYKTYKVDLKSGTYKEIKFDYLVAYASTYRIYTEYGQDDFKYMGFADACLIKDKNLSNLTNICLDNNLKVVQDDQNLSIYSTTYYDLNNGSYAILNGGYVSFTDKKGKIKKMFKGYGKLCYGSKLIVIYDSTNYEIKFLDFKGNYVGETIKYSNYISFISDKEFYYTDPVDGKYHLVTLDNGNVVSNVVVDYTVSSGSAATITTADKDGKNIFYSSSNYYFTAKKVDEDSDLVYDNFTLNLYSASGKQVLTDSKLLSYSLFDITNLDGYGAYIAVSTKDKVTSGLNSDYILQIDLITR